MMEVRTLVGVPNTNGSSRLQSAKHRHSIELRENVVIYPFTLEHTVSGQSPVPVQENKNSEWMRPSSNKTKRQMVPLEGRSRKPLDQQTQWYDPNVSENIIISSTGHVANVTPPMMNDPSQMKPAGSQSQQILFNVLCNNPSGNYRPQTQGRQAADGLGRGGNYLGEVVTLTHDGQRIMSADGRNFEPYSQDSNKNMQELKIDALNGNRVRLSGGVTCGLRSSGNSQCVQQLMKRTLSSQNNCFLPNYKKNHMMRRYEDQYSQYMDKSKIVQGHQKYKPSNFSYHAKNKQKTVQLAVANETGQVKGLNPQIQSRLVKYSSADLQSCLQPDIDSKVIKIQTAPPLPDQKTGDVVNPVFSASNTFGSSPNRATIHSTKTMKIVGSDAESLKVSTINDYTQQGTLPLRVVTLSTVKNGHQMNQRDDSPDYRQSSLVMQPIPSAVRVCTDETINNSSSNHQQYIQNQRLMDSRTYQMMLQDQSSKYSFLEAKGSSPEQTMNGGSFNIRNIEIEGRPALVNEGSFDENLPGITKSLGLNLLVNSQEEGIQEASPIKLRTGSRSNQISPKKGKDQHIRQQLRQIRRNSGEVRHQRNAKSRTNLEEEQIDKEKTEWQVLNVGIFNLSMTGTNKNRTLTSSHKQLHSQNESSGMNEGKIIRSYQMGRESRSYTRPQSGSPQRTNNIALLAESVTVTRVVPTLNHGRIMNESPQESFPKLNHNIYNEKSIEEEDSCKNPITKSVELMFQKNSSAHLEHQSKAISQCESTPNERLQFRQIYGEDGTLLHTPYGGRYEVIQPLTMQESGSAQIDPSPIPQTEIIVSQQQQLQSPKRDPNVLLSTVAAQGKNTSKKQKKIEVTNFLQQKPPHLHLSPQEQVVSHRSSNNTAHNEQQELISFGIQVFNHNKQPTTVAKKPKNKQNNSRDKSSSKQKGKVERAATARKVAKQQVPETIIENLEEHAIKKKTSQKIINTHQRNDTGIVTSKIENFGFFDSGGTNESNQQKLNFFENRYAPDDELEIGGIEKNSPQHLKYIREQSLKLENQKAQLSDSHQIMQVIGPLTQEQMANPIFNQLYAVGEDGQHYIVIDQAMLGHPYDQQDYRLNLLQQYQQSNRRQVFRGHPGRDDEIQSEEELVSLMNNQQQISLPELSEDLSHGIINLARIVTTSRHEVSDPSIPALQQTESKAAVVQMKLFNMPSLGGKTFHQCIAAKREEQLGKMGSRTQHLLKRQEDEEKQRELTSQLRKQSTDLSQICVQGINIKTIGQKMIDAAIIQQQQQQKNVVYVYDDLKHLEGFAGVTVTTLQQQEANTATAQGVESQSYTDRQVYQGTSAPNTMLINKYNNSLPAIIGTLSSEIPKGEFNQYLIRSCTYNNEGKNSLNIARFSGDGNTLNGGSSSSLPQNLNSDISEIILKQQKNETTRNDSPSQIMKNIQINDHIPYQNNQFGNPRSPGTAGSQAIVFNHQTIDSTGNSKEHTQLYAPITKFVASPKINAALGKRNGITEDISSNRKQFIRFNDQMDNHNEESKETENPANSNLYNTLPLETDPITAIRQSRNEIRSPTSLVSGQFYEPTVSLNNRLEVRESVGPKNTTTGDSQIVTKDSLQYLKSRSLERKGFESNAERHVKITRQESPQRSMVQIQKNQAHALAKSYSKMMKNIGEELKNIGPFISSSESVCKTKSELRSKQDLAVISSDPEISHDGASSFNNTGNFAGVTALIGIPTRTAQTAQGPRVKGGILRPTSPNLENLNISATVNHMATGGGSTTDIYNAKIRSSSQFSRAGSMYNRSIQGANMILQSQEFVPSNMLSDSQKNAGAWSQWPRNLQTADNQDLSSKARTNVIVDNFSNINNQNRVFLGSQNHKISQRISERGSIPDINSVKQGFGRKVSHSRKTQSMGIFQTSSQNNTSFYNPQQMAGLECLQAPNFNNQSSTHIVNSNEIVSSQSQLDLVRTTFYNGVFSAKTFEMVVPEKDQVIRVSSSHQQSRSKLPSFQVARRQAFISQVHSNQESPRVRPTSSVVRGSSLNTTAIVTQRRNSHNRTLSNNQVPQTVNQPLFSLTNKLKAFQRLKKGTVFRDEDFEAKKPNVKSGVKILSMY